MQPGADILKAEESLRAYCESVDFQGWDPWDALGSPLFGIFPFNLRIPRWAGNHLIKIAPLNVRPMLGIRKDCFAKGLALFLSGYVLRESSSQSRHNTEIIDKLLQRLTAKIIPGYSGPCWGTNLAYQTRAFFVPPNTPSLVHTAFAVDAILDLHEVKPNQSLLDLAAGSCKFALTDLKISQAGEGIYFSYTPNDDSRVVNVTALAARMLARTGKILGDRSMMEVARQAIRFVQDTQRDDGSWFYGEDPIHHWIDNYHTGFVLDALVDYQSYSDETFAEQTIKRGIEFYRRELFLDDGTPKFSPNSVYPIDGHCIAQGILTFTRLQDYHPDFLPFAQKIAEWGIRNFQDPKGYFYFQKRKEWTNKIPHIRWVQAWMFLALNRLAAAERNAGE
ncbi:MAG: hypothetical protein NTW14_04635 [bacterium]|nr:hypothetical protein [bacterium]